MKKGNAYAMATVLLGVTIKIRPPIFRKKIENFKNSENFKGDFRLFREMLVQN